MFNTTAAAFSGTAATPVTCNSKVWFAPSAPATPSLRTAEDPLSV